MTASRRALLLLLLGCGEVTFVDPNAELKAALQFARAERLIVEGDDRSYLFVRITSASTEGLRLFVEGPSGILELPMEAAAKAPCGEDTCFGITLGPGLPEALSTAGLSVPSLGHVARAPLLTNRSAGYSLNASAREANQVIELSISDPVRLWVPNFPRRFEVRTSSGACADPPQSTRWVALEREPGRIEATFSEAPQPLACIGVRPAVPLEGSEVARMTVLARAVTTRFRHVYTPPVERAPLVYRILFDLELPSAARCVEAQSLVRSALRQGAEDVVATIEGGLPILELEPVQIAVLDDQPCRQSNDRSFSAEGVFESTRAAVQDALGTEAPQRVVFLYVANLDAEPSPALALAFQNLQNLIVLNAGFRSYFMALASERAISGLAMEGSFPWIAADVPAFRTVIRSALSSVWPFSTALHSPATVVPLLGPEERGRFVAYRLCGLDPMIITPVGSPLSLSAWAPGPEGPAYQAALPEQRLVPVNQFMAPRVVLTWEGCERLCEHPAEGGDTRIPWLLLEDC